MLTRSIRRTASFALDLCWILSHVTTFQVFGFQVPRPPFSCRCEESSIRLDFGDAGAAEESSSSLPVGIFIDLDNVGPSTHSRSDARLFADPLRTFAERVGELDAFQAFGNQATRRHRSMQERERLAEERCQGPWDRENSHTGLDENGILRCGVCGSKMKLTKKDVKAGRTIHYKLNKHMKMLHDREERKRKSKPKKWNEKDRKKSAKYTAAQVDVRLPPNKNQLFRVLKECGIRCSTAENVDDTLIRQAQKWMKRLPKKRMDDDNDDSSLFDTIKGFLVIYSKDSDFCNLLENGRRKNLLVATVTPDFSQTVALEKASDLVLKNGGKAMPEAYSLKGVEFMREYEELWSQNDEEIFMGDEEDVLAEELVKDQPLEDAWWTSEIDNERW